MRSKAIPTFKIPESSACLDRYLRELHRIPLIDTEEEMQLAGRIRQGDEQALAALVCANLRFVVSIAKLYQHTYVPLMDLINEGNIGLVEAARRFDETKGFKFISYAVWWIRKSILAAISEQSRLVRLPDEKVKLVQGVQRVAERLEQQLGRAAGIEEIAEALGRSAADVEQALVIGQRHQSVYAGDEEGPIPLLEIIMDESVPAWDERRVNQEALRMEIAERLSILNDRERTIVRLYFGLDGDAESYPGERSFEAIGQRVGICGERARIIKNRALVKLRVGVMV